MAEIYGITLKGCKEFQRREGNGVQGNVYMDVKRSAGIANRLHQISFILRYSS